MFTQKRGDKMSRLLESNEFTFLICGPGTHRTRSSRGGGIGEIRSANVN